MPSNNFMNYMATRDRWLTKQEYSKIRYRAKKLGCTQANLSCLWHDVLFKHCFVTFIFKPLEYRIHLSPIPSMNESDFEDLAGMEEIVKDMQSALDFVEFLKEFEKTIEED